MIVKTIDIAGRGTHHGLFFRKAVDRDVKVYRTAMFGTPNQSEIGKGKIIVTENEGGPIGAILIQNASERFNVTLEPRRAKIKTEQRIDLENLTTMGIVFQITETE